MRPVASRRASVLSIHLAASRFCPRRMASRERQAARAPGRVRAAAIPLSRALGPRAGSALRAGMLILVAGTVAYVVKCLAGSQAPWVHALFDRWLYNILLVGAASACAY